MGRTGQVSDEIWAEVDPLLLAGKRVAALLELRRRVRRDGSAMGVQEATELMLDRVHEIGAPLPD